jgi:hypothetical protein
VETDVPVVEIGVRPAPPAKPVAQPAPKGEVLMNPGRIFKCEVNGRVTFSEQPCAAAPGEVKVEPVVKPPRSR